jgi:hypothetical protein
MESAYDSRTYQYLSALDFTTSDIYFFLFQRKIVNWVMIYSYLIEILKFSKNQM